MIAVVESASSPIAKILNEKDTSSLTAKIRNIERQMVEGKRVLMGNDWEPLKTRLVSLILVWICKNMYMLLQIKQVVEPVIQHTPSFASLVCNESCTRKVNFILLDTSKPTNELAEIHIS